MEEKKLKTIYEKKISYENPLLSTREIYKVNISKINKYETDDPRLMIR